jgi:hypothetical protein
LIVCKFLTIGSKRRRFHELTVERQNGGDRDIQIDKR